MTPFDSGVARFRALLVAGLAGVLLVSGLLASSSEGASSSKRRARAAKKPAPAVDSTASIFTPPKLWPTPADTLADGRVRLIWIDFGPPLSEPQGSVAFNGELRNHYYGWTGGLIRIVRRPYNTHGAYWCDFAEGEDAWFVIAVDRPEPCRVRLTLGDPEAARGPVEVSTPAGVVASDVRTKAGESRDIEFEVEPVDGRLAIHLKAGDCGSFAAAGIVVYGVRGLDMVETLFEGGRMLGTIVAAPGANASLPPPPAPAVAADDAGVRETLRRYCEFLLGQQPAEGCFSSTGNWYETAYPTRTLLAAGQLLNEPRYTAAAVECLDRFASEQLDNANWAAGYFGRRGCDLALAARMNPRSANLADVGTMSLALMAATGQVDTERRQLYLEAVRRYSDQIVLPNQLDSGAFPNRKFAGVDNLTPYSVATGVQAASLAALGALTGDTRYQAAAEAAARFLLKGFDTPGRYLFSQFNTTTPQEIKFKQIGDLFYVMEGLVWVRHYTSDAALAREIQKALDLYLWGTNGIGPSLTSDVLWKAKDAWEASKQGGLLFLLNEYRDGVRRGLDPEASTRWVGATDTWITNFRRMLGDPRRAAQLGILVDSAAPDGAYAFPATGFSGIGLADALDPNVLFPAAGGR